MPVPTETEVLIQAGNVELEGNLSVPDNPAGLVLFAHGSGSSRHSPRNRYVARLLNDGGLATLLFDLLTAEENEIDMRTRQIRFDTPLLAERLTAAVDWLPGQQALRDLPVGLFGASTGAAAALMTAAERPGAIRAVVSRGGRPDLAGPALPEVQAPTLLIVGGDDVPVIQMNRTAAEQMRAPHRIEIVPGATHLFEEPGALEQVSRLTRDWFLRHFEG